MRTSIFIRYIQYIYTQNSLNRNSDTDEANGTQAKKFKYFHNYFMVHIKPMCVIYIYIYCIYILHIYISAQGLSEAMFSVALCHELGDGVSVDVKEARSWCRRAQAAGHYRAAHKLVELLGSLSSPPN
jgi:TPR repeat protein